MKHYIYKIAFLFIFFLISCNDEEPKIEPTDFTTEIADKNKAALIKENLTNFPNSTEISIAIIDNNETDYIGVLKKNDVFQIANNKNNVFEIGSITKVFTSILLSDAINKGKASLSETLQEQFNFTLKNGGNIQLSQLANHTSGLPRVPTNYDAAPDFNPIDPFASYTPNLLEDYLKNEIVLKNEIGSKFEYSNLGASLLGYILSKKAGKTYENLLQETILTPLQMNNSTTELSNIDPNLLVSGLDENGNISPNWNFTNTSVAAGGIKSSVADLEKFIHKNFEEDDVYNLPQTITYSHDEHQGLGLGWFITGDADFTILFHNGNTGGYSSALAIDKKNKKAVVVLSNVPSKSPNFEQINTMCTSLLKYISTK
ncbi:serine hydrolase domain-containing protein [Tenacibaculum ovolyticum]|uniref:serine hydrolase domain-containing protein n=1 Tax=Tenacibaculum ovolyticum TaxID=104270 RepID=UPI0003F6EBA9|nr:serine hydrolase domain-containing protein [Tenacibaculum ovolyticum]